jgi:hypothetical protein
VTTFVKVIRTDGSFIAIGVDWIKTIEPADRGAKITIEGGREILVRATAEKVTRAAEKLLEETRIGLVDNSLFGQVFGPRGGR